jgi:hypothetical protein
VLLTSDVVDFAEERALDRPFISISDCRPRSTVF